jgi:hypothetical protein
MNEDALGPIRGAICNYFGPLIPGTLLIAITQSEQRLAALIAEHEREMAGLRAVAEGAKKLVERWKSIPPSDTSHIDRSLALLRSVEALDALATGGETKL